ncbi:S49 family peptidase [Sphingomonas sp. OTU376]|uniref:S49 family peptidase n=1 Tax=Sphingomonas sp. OTU376 TaxID=3043863 RepID=UPI00313DD5E4
MDVMASTALWAMHPAFLDALLKKGALESFLPDVIKNFAGISAPAAAKAADPIREGASIIVPMHGVMAPSGVYSGASVMTDVLANRIREFGADSKIGTVILDVRSPGGLVWGTQELADAVYEVRQLKPVVAVANPYCFSAAYHVATQASAFFVTTSGEVANVGVRSGHTDMSGFEEKIGMKTTPIASHPDKIAAHPHAPLTDEDRADIQASVEAANQAFVAAIARGRGMKVADVPAVHGTGKTFRAEEAFSRGATDGVMTLRDVIAKYSSSRSRLDLMRRRAEMQGQAATI